MPRRIRLYLDFDGTITRNDVGDELIRTFGQFEPLHAELLAGQHTVAEYYRIASQTLRSECTPAALHAFACMQDVDASFAALINWCAQHNVDVCIVSDGFDAYITPILHSVHVDVPVYSNALTYDGTAWTASFPGATESCSCFCASCKRNVLLTTAGPDDVIVYVGDGLSDTCAAEHSDIVFAKGALAAHCTASGVAHHHFHTLFDVLSILRRRLEANDLRPRLQAERLRKRAIEAE